MINNWRFSLVILLVGLLLTGLAVFTEGKIAFIGVFFVLTSTILMGANKNIGFFAYLIGLVITLGLVLFAIDFILSRIGSENWGIHYSLAVIILIVLAGIFAAVRLFVHLRDRVSD